MITFWDAEVRASTYKFLFVGKGPQFGPQHAQKLKFPAKKIKQKITLVLIKKKKPRGGICFWGKEEWEEGNPLPMFRMRCPSISIVHQLLMLQVPKKIMPWVTHHTWNDRLSKKLYAGHYGDMIYHSFQYLADEKDGQGTNTAVATHRTQWTIVYIMPLHFTFSVVLLSQYAWDTNEEYLFKAMVAFSMRKVPNRETTE